MGRAGRRRNASKSTDRALDAPLRGDPAEVPAPTATGSSSPVLTMPTPAVDRELVDECVDDHWDALERLAKR